MVTGRGSAEFIDLKFEPLGPIHHGPKPRFEQPSRSQLKQFHEKHEELLKKGGLYSELYELQYQAQEGREASPTLT